MRTSHDQFVGGRLMNGYDYTHQAWVKDGQYVRCGHLDDCTCYGRLHEGEQTRVSVSGLLHLRQA